MEFRKYTSKELNALLQVTRAPLLTHHPVIQMLISMALLTESIHLVCSGGEDPDDWMHEVQPILVRELLRGTACVLDMGVRADGAIDPNQVN